MRERIRAMGVFALSVLSASGVTASAGGPAEADLAISVTATPSANVAPGAPITYTLTVTNHGPDASGAARATMLLDFGQPTSVPPGCQMLGSAVSCDVASMASGASVDIVVECWVYPSPSISIHNNAHIEGPVADPVPRNNDYFLTTTVQASTVRQELAHGSRLTGVLLARDGIEGDTYKLRQQPFSSYEIVVDATSGDIGVGQGPFTERIGPVDPFPSFPLQSSEPVGTGPSRTLRFMNTTADVVDGEEIRVRPAWTLPVGGVDDVYQLRAYDTTYAIPRFNNAGTQRTVLIVHNPTARPVTVVASFWSETGAPLATHDAGPIAAHGVMVLDTAGVPGLAGAAGSITIANDAPYGALAGKAVTLDTAAGFAFDTRMEPRVR